MFTDYAVATRTIEELLSLAIREAIEIVAFCVMPEHVHLLLAGLTEDSHIPTTVRRWKQRTGYWYQKRRQQKLWQGNYWDRVLRRRDHLRPVLEYILSDPVRSGLVSNLKDYSLFGSTRLPRSELVAIGMAGAEKAWLKPGPTFLL